MNKSDSILNLSAALVKAQANIGGAVKDTKNPFFKSNYADLGEIMHVCKSALLDQGIVVSQFVTTTDNGPGLETILIHEGGEWMSSVMPVVCSKQNDPQALGSAITYARRYALQSALFIPAVDDDAEAAMYREKKASKRDSAITAREERREEETRVNAGTAAPVRLMDAVPVVRDADEEPVVNPVPAEIKRIDGTISDVVKRTVPVRGKVKAVFDVTIKGHEPGQVATASTFSESLGAQAQTYCDTGERVIAGIEPKDGKPWLLKTLEDADVVEGDAAAVS